LDATIGLGSWWNQTSLPLRSMIIGPPGPTGLIEIAFMALG